MLPAGRAPVRQEWKLPCDDQSKEQDARRIQDESRVQGVGPREVLEGLARSAEGAP